MSMGVADCSSPHKLLEISPERLGEEAPIYTKVNLQKRSWMDLISMRLQ